MSSDEKKQWIVLDCITKIQSQLMTDQQLQMSVLRMHEKDWDRFFIWTDTWGDWLPLRTFLKSDQKNFLNILNITKDTEALEITVTKSITMVGAVTDQTNPSYRAKQDAVVDFEEIDFRNTKPPQNINFKKLNDKQAFLNRATRHDLKIEILLLSKSGKTFRSYSKNISLTGSLLEDNIPFDYYGGVFDVVVVNRYAKQSSQSRVQVKGFTVGDGVSRRIQFESINEAAKTRLVFLLNEYLDNQKKNVKKTS